MKHLNCLADRTWMLLTVRIAVLVAVSFICCNVPSVSQILRKPIEGDSLSFKVTIAGGFGSGSLDVNKLNETLKLSNLNKVESRPLMLSLNMKIPIGRGYLLGIDGNHYLDLSSSTTDTNGLFTTRMTAGEVGMNIGYSLVHNNLFMVVPSIGFTFTKSSTTISFTSKKSPTPIPFDEGVKTELLNQGSTQTESMNSSFNLAVRLETYIKLFSFGTETREAQVLPNRPINSETRTDLWLGGFASYSPWLYSSSDNGNLRFCPSGFNFGVSLMLSVSSRLIAL